jgi:hypothetical protein
MIKSSLTVRSCLIVALVIASGCDRVTAAEDPQSNCFWQLVHGRGTDLVCEHKAWITEEERADLKKLTREILQDVRCTVSINIKRVLVDDALELTDHVFQAPPQPVACEIATKDSALPITGTFAPRVVIKEGKAVEATPGLADVKGVTGVLSWPVVQYVNRAPGVRNEMLRMIN